MLKRLDLQINISSGNNVSIQFFEPESGNIETINETFSAESSERLGKLIGQEVYSWISLWVDECERYTKELSSYNL